jgi:hypothetical protein
MAKLTSLYDVSGLSLQDVVDQKYLVEELIAESVRRLQPLAQVAQRQLAYCRAIQEDVTNHFHPTPAWPLDSDHEGAHKNDLEHGIIMLQLCEAACAVGLMHNIEHAAEASDRVNCGAYIVQLCKELRCVEDLLVKVPPKPEMTWLYWSRHSRITPAVTMADLLNSIDASVGICRSLLDIILAHRRIHQLKVARQDTVTVLCHHPSSPTSDRH